jgi:hypothetical protein
MLDTKTRLVGATLSSYIENELYWVLHAPRQTGKTTFLQSWMKEINESGEAIACYVSVERCQGFPDAEDAIPAVCYAINEFAGKSFQKLLIPDIPQVDSHSQLSTMLSNWAKKVAPKPLIVLFDEVDTLQDQAMISFLRQLRSGFSRRGVGKYPVSIALVGMRDLRDYLVKSKDGVSVNPGSPFNIKEDSATLNNFSKSDVFDLIKQHIDETGQIFEESAIELIFELTQGQPWLVNALAKKCVWDIVPQEKGETVTTEHIMIAKEKLILARAVHLDSLSERLKDPRVKPIIETIITGDIDPNMAEGDDFVFCTDLGLVTTQNQTPQIANPIYREVISRVLTQGMQYAIPQPEFKWQKDDGSLDYDALFEEFQKFWRRHSAAWEVKVDYQEAFPHLLVMAFLQRVINGGGRIEREYAAGRGRVDLAVEWHSKWTVIEIKLVHPYDNLKTTIEEGLKQTAKYRDTVGAHEAWLIVFDRREKARAKPWEERLRKEQHQTPGGPITVITC